MNKFLEKDTDGNWNTVPPIPVDKIRNVNCHKFILYIINKISWDEMISDPKTVKEGLDFTYGEQARTISDTSYTPIKDLGSLYSLANQSCEIGKAYVGQILDAQTNEMAHSFIITREQDNKYNCYDKQGFKYLFSVCELGTLLDFVNKDGEKSYQNQNWRFVPFKVNE